MMLFNVALLLAALLAPANTAIVDFFNDKKCQDFAFTRNIWDNVQGPEASRATASPTLCLVLGHRPGGGNQYLTTFSHHECAVPATSCSRPDQKTVGECLGANTSDGASHAIRGIPPAVTLAIPTCLSTPRLWFGNSPSAMRLLNTTTKRLEVFMGDDVPAYAILSHTWGPLEITLQALEAHHLSPLSTLARAYFTGETKIAFDKIHKSCDIALENGFDYIWIDTCCIDKTSSAELSEAINSMFRWYNEAAVCYAYLSDLPPSSFVLSRDTLKKCRWFSRGWTLQELIAPRRVHFYDANWTLRGTKDSLRHVISDATKIDTSILADPARMYSVPVARKMSWAAGRQTTRVEDLAYCLLGIFDINFPLLYGEGTKAFRRLQEEIMKQTSDMSLLAWLPDTSEEPVREIWARSPSEFAWLRIHPGLLRVRGQFNHDIDISNKGLRVSAHLIQLPPSPDEDKSESPQPSPQNSGLRPPYHTHVLNLKCSLTRMVNMGICLHKFGPNLFVRDISGPWETKVILPPSTNRLVYQTPSHQTSQIWLLSDRDLLQPWMAENMPYRIPRKVFREFNPRCQKLHFTFSSLPPTTPSQTKGAITVDENSFEITALNGSVWDSSTQTLHTGWSTPIDREVLVVKFRFSQTDSSPPTSPTQSPNTDTLIIAIEGLSTGGAVLLLSPACLSGSKALSTDLTLPNHDANTNLIDLVHSEFRHIFNDLLLNWGVPRDFHMELGSGSQPAWRVRVAVEEKKKVAGIPAMRPILKIGIGLGAVDSVGADTGVKDVLKKAVFTGLGRIQKGWDLTGARA
ncbi:heterokaryon incompatibility protein-domain-containing protein [Cercophora newfieldiana]|uniref:Heterokaryon incompatibility protein-domain-containing protein n=1 Tax=Cercophora newfieldiana TaxID=92897 RepID=A0AA40CMH6_9PEZI|nr:heterokaryon incompatibility protein-domain-containing protein [Cercophora newfieldiana]